VGPDLDTSATKPPGFFAWVSYSGAGGLNGASPSIFKTGDIKHVADRILFAEENDPRNENEGSWDQTWQPELEDSTACWHVHSSTFSYTDGHVDSHRWLDPINITYALSMNPGKYSGAATNPNRSNCPHDLAFVFDDFAGPTNP
jgi:hypothetical protein